MTCKDVGLCLDDACSSSNFSASMQLKDSTDEECVTLSILSLFDDAERLESIFLSIVSRCSCKA